MQPLLLAWLALQDVLRRQKAMSRGRAVYCLGIRYDYPGMYFLGHILREHPCSLPPAALRLRLVIGELELPRLSLQSYLIPHPVHMLSRILRMCDLLELPAFLTPACAHWDWHFGGTAQHRDSLTTC